MVPETKMQPNRAEVERHINHITRRWHELGEASLLEVVHLTDDDKATVKDIAHFEYPERVGEAIDHIVAMNPYHLNSYATVNPVSATNRPPAGKRASKEHILASFFHWADGDTAEAGNNILEFVGPKPTFVVLTGTVPHYRPHVYWELEDPTRNFEPWERIQRNMAATLKTDPAVVDPPRIMRVAGTVNWPKPKKIAKGYKVELTALTIHDPKDRPPVTSEQMDRAFQGSGRSTPTTSGGGLQIDTGIHHGKSVSDYLDVLRRVRTDGEKHTGVRDLTASLAGQGVSAAAAEALCRSILPIEWDENCNDLLRSAYEKYARPAERVRPLSTILSSSDFLAGLRPPNYLVEGILQRGYTHSMTGYTGHGKTTLALHLMLCVAMGEPFGGCECTPGSVLFIAGENPDNVRYQYAAAIAAIGKTAEEVPAYFLPGHFQLSTHEDALHEECAKIPDLSLIVVDSLQSFFEGDSDNSNVQMIETAQRFRRLSALPSSPAVMVISHPAGKKADRSNLVPRGGSAFINELDGNFTVWGEPDGTQSFHWEGKHRGAPFDAMDFVMADRSFDHIADHKGNPLSLKVSRQQMEIERSNAAKKAEGLDREIMQMIDGDPKVTERAIATALRATRYRVREAITKLKDDKLIKRKARKWLVTQDGEDYLEGI